MRVLQRRGTLLSQLNLLATLRIGLATLRQKNLACVNHLPESIRLDQTA